MLLKLIMVMKNIIKKLSIIFSKKNIKKISFVLTIFYSDIKNKTKIIKEILQHQDDDSLKEKEKIIEWAKGLILIKIINLKILVLVN